MKSLTKVPASILLLLASSLISSSLLAVDYSAQQHRQVKSLSADDIQQIQAGKGWGLAKAAELNGYPGPRHVLDMAEELALSNQQQTEMTRLFDLMKLQAVDAGKAYLAAERQLEQAFRNRTIESRVLRSMLDTSAAALATLRYIHLDTHLATISRLSDHQIKRYNGLRGYEQTTGSGQSDIQKHLH